ncbi:MAG: hypothetical protein LBT82_01745, partial [Oscillospiraceae bacterium]|nr:hypothetical protein [Oscillospiraceae bacterium]
KNHCYALVGISERNKKFYLQLIDPHGRDLFKRLPFNKKSLIGASGLFSIKFEEFLENSAVFTFIEM